MSQVSEFHSLLINPGIQGFTANLAMDQEYIGIDVSQDRLDVADFTLSFKIMKAMHNVT